MTTTATMEARRPTPLPSAIQPPGQRPCPHCLRVRHRVHPPSSSPTASPGPQILPSSHARQRARGQRARALVRCAVEPKTTLRKGGSRNDPLNEGRAMIEGPVGGWSWRLAVLQVLFRRTAFSAHTAHTPKERAPINTQFQIAKYPRETFPITAPASGDLNSTQSGNCRRTCRRCLAQREKQTQK